MTTSFRTLILNRPEDWPLWFEVIRAQAEGKLIWEYVNPNRDNPEVLQKPEYPSIKDVNEQKTRYSELTEDEKAEYEFFPEKFSYDIENIGKKPRLFTNCELRFRSV